MSDGNRTKTEPQETEVIECPGCGWMIHPTFHVCRGWRDK